jgi:hypothetical protein
VLRSPAGADFADCGLKHADQVKLTKIQDIAALRTCGSAMTHHPHVRMIVPGVMPTRAPRSSG